MVLVPSGSMDIEAVAVHSGPGEGDDMVVVCSGSVNVIETAVMHSGSVGILGVTGVFMVRCCHGEFRVSRS